MLTNDDCCITFIPPPQGDGVITSRVIKNLSISSGSLSLVMPIKVVRSPSEGNNTKSEKRVGVKSFNSASPSMNSVGRYKKKILWVDIKKNSVGRYKKKQQQQQQKKRHGHQCELLNVATSFNSQSKKGNYIHYT